MLIIYSYHIDKQILKAGKAEVVIGCPKEGVKVDLNLTLDEKVSCPHVHVGRTMVIVGLKIYITNKAHRIIAKRASLHLTISRCNYFGQNIDMTTICAKNLME